MISNGALCLVGPAIRWARPLAFGACSYRTGYMGLRGIFQAPEIMREPAPSAPNYEVHGASERAVRTGGGAEQLVAWTRAGMRLGEEEMGVSPPCQITLTAAGAPSGHPASNRLRRKAYRAPCGSPALEASRLNCRAEGTFDLKKGADVVEMPLAMKPQATKWR